MLAAHKHLKKETEGQIHLRAERGQQFMGLQPLTQTQSLDIGSTKANESTSAGAPPAPRPIRMAPSCLGENR